MQPTTQQSKRQKEHVLHLPARLTKTAYQTLLQSQVVPRQWHLEGRFGSRTHAVVGAERSLRGIPVLYDAMQLEEVAQTSPELRELLDTDGVSIVEKEFVHNHRSKLDIPEVDARIHPELEPKGFVLPDISLKRLDKSVVSDSAFTYGEMFGGIGGFGVALEQLGGKCVFYSEIDERCRETYALNFDTPLNCIHRDIYKVPDAAFPNNLDLLVAGFPCQPFSTLGEQPGFHCDKGRGHLYLEIVRALKSSRPKAFLFENVQGLLGLKDTLNEIVTAFRGAGYDVNFEVCSARGLTATNRKRTMSGDLLNIIANGDDGTKGISSNPSPFHSGGGGAKVTFDDKKQPGAPSYLGLNLGRSQSAAPETWEYGKIPSSTKSAAVDDGLFARSRFFDEEEEDRENAGLRRPASTGVIGPNAGAGGTDGDVNSILETLGLTTLESADEGQQNTIPSYSSGTPLGGLDNTSLMEKIQGTPQKSSWGQGSSGNVFTPSQGGGMQQYTPSTQTAPQAHAHQYVHQSPATQQPQQVYQQGSSHYQPQQQVYYQHQQPVQVSPQAGYQNYGGQQGNVNVMPGQQTVYHVNAPAAPYGYEYHQPQQHVIMSPAGQPQYVTLVPQVMGAPGGHGQYAYVQYGAEGVAMAGQPAMAPATFVMGPNGPIAVAANPGMMPLNAMSYSGHGSSPPGGGRSPTRGSSGGMRTPDRMGRKKNPMSSPRSKRGDRNANTPSKLGPQATVLLNEIRQAKSRNQWTIHDIKGHVVEFCLDQNGSRFVQQRLEVADAIEKDAVLAEIIPAIKELQNDVFGNYVIQKMYEFGNEGMHKDLKGTLEGNMLLLSLQMYGCRVVQKSIESLDYDDVCELLPEFDGYVLTCIQDQNGNHVMQKCIEVMSIRAKEAEARIGEAGLADRMAGKVQFIVDDVLNNVKQLCCHPYGCRVLQRMLEHCVPFQKTATLDKIQLVHQALLDDQYGNYVIQHVLQYGRESDRDSLLKIIIENDLLKLSRQKFASNVVEKLLKYGNSNQRNAIVREMLKEGVGSSVLLLMVRDAYANYVVQTTIDVVPEGHEKRMLLEELKANEVQLRNYTFAKHIVAKLGSK
ncbi:hypothetical protein ACHAXT_000516 [Thalassiosira profunda]